MQTECYKCKAQFETTSEHVKQCPACSKAHRIAMGVQKADGWERKTADIVEYRKQWRKDNPDKFRKYEQSKPKRTPEQDRAKYVRKMKRLHGEDWQPKTNLPEDEKAIRDKARERFKTAIKRKKILREPCLICGELKAEGHHTDYSKPLDVVWLCRKHHVEAHYPKP